MCLYPLAFSGSWRRLAWFACPALALGVAGIVLLPRPGHAEGPVDTGEPAHEAGAQTYPVDEFDFLAALADQPVRHPLLSDEAQLLVQSTGLSVEELYREVMVIDSASKVNGVYEARSYVELRDVEELAPDARVERSFAPVTFVLTDEVVSWREDSARPKDEQLEVDVVLDRSLWDDTVSTSRQAALAMLRGLGRTGSTTLEVLPRVLCVSGMVPR